MNIALQLAHLARVFPPAIGWHECTGKLLCTPSAGRSASHWQPLHLLSQHHPAAPFAICHLPFAFLILFLLLHHGL